MDKYRIISIDLPGFGFSDTPNEPWTVNDYSEFLGEIIKYFTDERVILLGHSFGGRVAIKFCSTHPLSVEKIVLVDSAGIVPKRQLSYYIKVYSYKVLKRIGSLLGIKSQKILKNFGSADYNESGNMKSTFINVVNEDLQEDMKKISSNTAIIWGENDITTPISDAYKIHKFIKGSKLFIINNAGHFCFIDNYVDFINVLNKTLGE